MALPHIVLYGAFFADRGGIEHSVLSLVAALRDRYRFTIVCPMSDAFAAEAQAAGAGVERAAVPSAFSGAAIWRLARRLRGDLAANLIHTLDPRGATVGCPAGRVARLPVVYWNHISPLDFEGLTPLRRRFYALGEAFLGWLCVDAALFVADSVRERYVKGHLVPARRSHYIPNSVDSAALAGLRGERAAVRAEYGIAEDEFLWVNLGRLTPQKGQEVLVNAAAQLPSGWRLLIAGDGVLYGALRAQIEALDLSDRVQLLSGLPSAKARRLLGAADGFVLASRYENMPISILESLAVGVPLVVTDVGDSCRLVSGGELPPAGICVEAEDSVGLAAAMRQVMQDAELRAKLQAACEARAALFPPERMVESIARHYASLL